MHKKKLAIFINALEVAGAEKAVSLIINHFHKEFDIHLILLNNTIQFELPHGDIAIKVIDNSNLNASSRVMDIVKIPLLSHRLKKYLEANDINTCFSVLNRSNFINCFLKVLGWKGNILISERAYTSSVYSPNSFAGKTGRFLVKALYKKANVIVPNSFAIAKDLKDHYGLDTKYTVVYNPLNIPEHENQLKVPVEDVAFDEFTFIHVGRFEKQKNHLLFLQAIQLIKHRPFKVLLVGQGSLEETMKRKAIEMGIDDKLIFLGYRNNVVKYVARSQCHVMTSDFEGFPNVLLEALASGTAVISTDCPSGPREMLTGIFDPAMVCTGIEKGKYGILVPVNNAQILANAMELMMDDTSLRSAYAHNGKTRARDFNLPVIMEQYGKVFREYL